MTGDGQARWRGRLGAGLMAAALVAGAWSAVTLLSGGFVLTGAFPVSSRDPWRPLGAAAFLFALAWLVHREGAGRTLRATTGRGPILLRRVALAAACAIFIAAAARNTGAAGGSDSSCYVLQADAFRHGQVALREPLARELPVAHAGAVFAPTGFLASPVDPYAAVPICGPGLAIAMAAASLAGGRAMMLVVPACGALLVWSTFLLGRRIDDDCCGAAASVLVAVSPIVLYQVVQPMSDIPAAALWVAATAAVARRDMRGAMAGGLLASAAVLVRPNLALPVPVLAGVLLAQPAPWRERSRLLAAFGAAAMPCLITLAWLNTRRYGSPLVSGYGETGALFALAHVQPNLARYTRWLIVTETPFVVLALVAPLWARRHLRRDAALVAATLLAIALIVSTYLAYTVFSDWWYVRFLLPALPLLLVLALAVWLSLGGNHPMARGALALVTCAILGAFYGHVARERRAFDLQSLESRFVLTGRYAGRALPDTAVVLAVQESGAVRHHGRRLTAMWDQLEPGELDRTIAWLTARGRPVFIALEDAETPLFRARFATQQFGRLDWPPQAEIHAAVRVFVYAAADRERFRRGVPLSPEHVR